MQNEYAHDPGVKFWTQGNTHFGKVWYSTKPSHMFGYSISLKSAIVVGLAALATVLGDPMKVGKIRLSESIRNLGKPTGYRLVE